MNCTDARHRILIADVAALSGEMDAELAAHLGGCAACTAAASTVLAETDRLRAALIARGSHVGVLVATRRSRGRRIAIAVVPLALAAGIAAVAVLSNRDSRASIRPPMFAAVPKNQTPALVARGGPPAAGVNYASPVPETQPSSQVPAVEVVPVLPAELTANDPALTDVRVTVGEKQNAAIITTTNPKITLVWITRGDTL